MTHQHHSGLPESFGSGTPSMNGHPPHGAIHTDTSSLHHAADIGDPLAEARYDREMGADPGRQKTLPPVPPGWVQPISRHLWVGREDLHGLASTREVRQRSTLTAAFGTGANVLNFILVQPFLAALSGPIAGTAISVGVYWLSNVSQKISVRAGDERRPWAGAGFAGFALLSILQTGLSPWGTALLLFRHDLNNQLAERVVSDFVNADVTAGMTAAQDKRKRAADRQEECDEHRRNYEKLKAAGNEAYHTSYRLAYGAYMANEPANRWQGVSERDLPACPAAKLLALEADTEMEQAKTQHDRRIAQVRTDFGDSYLTYLKEERPDLFEAYFKRGLSGYRIRSGVTELAEAQALVVSGKAAPTLVMAVFTALSAITSLTALALTRHHAKDPLVRQSWSALARSRQIQALSSSEHNALMGGQADEQ